MVGKRLIFVCVLLLIAVQMNRVNSQPLFFVPELLKFLKLQEITSQLKNYFSQGSGGISDITSMTQSLAGSSSVNGNEKQESVATSFIKLLTP